MLHILLLLQLSGFNVEVFYSSTDLPSLNYIQSENVRYFDLDAPSNIERQINQRLEGITENTAASDFARFQNSPEGVELIESLTDSYTAISRAVHLGLTHVPAVVINGHTVVYGTSDVRAALKELPNED